MAWRPRWLGGGGTSKPSRTKHAPVRRVPRSSRLVRRSYQAGQLDRLSKSFLAPQSSADVAIGGGLRRMRGRSRFLDQNSAYARRYYNLQVKNLAGPDGVKMRMRARRPDGLVDFQANQRIQDSWRLWCRRGNTTVCGQHSWSSLQRLAVRSVSRDGELLIRFVLGAAARNPWGFALEVKEADHLEDNLNQPLGGGRQIRMGVELDQWRRPIAYWIRVNHPGDMMRAMGVQTVQRVPATEMLHLFSPDRAEQTRGVPWFHASMSRLAMLDGYEEAEVVASRAAASKMGFYQSQTDPEEFDTPETKDEDAQDEEIELLEEFEAGEMHRLPFGMKAELFDPKHPTTQVGPFMKSVLKGIASGGDVSYPALGNDLEGVNLASLRHHALDERDGYRVGQQWLVDWLCQPIFDGWLMMQLTNGSLGLSTEEFERLSAAAIWKPRGWKWTDPQKESRANREQVAMSIQSLTRLAEEQGVTLEELLQERADEIRMAAELRVPISLGREFDGDDEEEEPEASPPAESDGDEEPDEEDGEE